MSDSPVKADEAPKTVAPSETKPAPQNNNVGSGKPAADSPAQK